MRPGLDPENVSLCHIGARQHICLQRIWAYPLAVRLIRFIALPRAAGERQCYRAAAAWDARV